MNLVDLFLLFKWWITLLIIGLIFLPLTFNIFKNFKDKGYIFSKIVGLIFISYTVFILSSVKLLKFSSYEIIAVMFIFLIINIFTAKKTNFINLLKQNWKIIIIEELIFLITFSFWTYIRGNNPDIHGLEKFMDFGFVNSILRTNYFPPQDMWYAGLPVNYYYFGHFVTAVIIKLSTVASNVGYNLMLASLFAFTFTCVLSISINLFDNNKLSLKSMLTGLVSAVIITFGGNLTTIYTFFKAYTPMDQAIPFWNLQFLPLSFPNGYWYPNATRFIPFTIHEFPLYSFVVSDLHGHVIDIPFVLLTLAFLFSIFISKQVKKIHLIFVSLLLAIMYMTNAWDGLIYMLLSIFVLIFMYFYKEKKKWSFSKNNIYDFISANILLGIGFFVFTLPFNIHFKPFVSGIGIICAPKFLTNIGKIGPLLFEVNHCQRSPFWQLTILYGFFYFFVVCFMLFLKFKKKYIVTKSDKFIAFLIILSTILIIVPEFIYVKDIYPMHYRANTMFKLVYESFIMLSISSGYIIIKIIASLKNKKFILIFFLPSLLLLYMVLTYPIFAINSFYNNLSNYKGINGTDYIKKLYPEDYDLINYINNNIKDSPVILEANGDSYTDFARISANTGLPTVVGWPVHEWLWRGTYDIVSPRITDVSNLYTIANIKTAKKLIKKYNISYAVVSSLEKQKYPNITEDNFRNLGKIIFQKGETKLYKITF